jgi:hypothetical protein
LITGSVNGGQESNTHVAAVCLGDGCAAAVTGRF